MSPADDTTYAIEEPKWKKETVYRLQLTVGERSWTSSAEFWAKACETDFWEFAKTNWNPKESASSLCLET